MRRSLPHKQTFHPGAERKKATSLHARICQLQPTTKHHVQLSDRPPQKECAECCIALNCCMLVNVQCGVFYAEMELIHVCPLSPARFPFSSTASCAGVFCVKLSRRCTHTFCRLGKTLWLFFAIKLVCKHPLLLFNNMPLPYTVCTNQHIVDRSSMLTPQSCRSLII
jgi:hypothetical protein